MSPSVAIGTHDIGCKPVTLAAAEAPAIIRPISRRLKAACDRLTVIIAEPAGYARRQTGVLRSVKHTKELHFEAPIYASDRVVHHWHASFFRRLRILPREILVDELSKAFRDSHRFALLLDRHFPQLLYLDGVLLGRPLVERPQVSVAADLS